MLQNSKYNSEASCSNTTIQLKNCEDPMDTTNLKL